MRTAIFLFTAAAALGACAGEAASDGAPLADAFCEDALARVEAFMATVDAAEDPDRGGTAVLGATGDFPGLMGLTTSDYNAHQHQLFVNGMTLVRYDEGLEPVPYLAESWEWDAAGTELTFHLRDDVMWHDGMPTTARDVAFTYLRAVDPETEFANPAYFQFYEGVEVLDDHTVRFRVRPHAMPLDTWRSTPIMPAHLLGDVPPSELSEHPYGSVCPVGNGPFRFVSHTQADRWIFEANPAFPDGLGGRPSVDRYVYRVVPDASTLLTELLNGGIDLYHQMLPDQYGTVDGADGVRVLSFPSRDYLFLAWNARRPLLSDPEVRRALTMAIDRPGLVDALLGGRGMVANSGVTRVHWALASDLTTELPYDTAAARALLAELGWVDRDGDDVLEDAAGTPFVVELKMNTESALRVGLAEIIQAQLAQVGVEVTLRPSDYGTFVMDIIDPDRPFDAFLLTYTADFRVDDRDMFHSASSESLFAFSGVQSDRLDSLIDTLQTIADEQEAAMLWREYQMEIIREQPYTYLFYPDRLVGVSDRIQDVLMDARGEWVGIHDWRVPPDRRKYVAPATQ